MHLGVVVSLSGKLVHLVLLQLIRLGQSKGQDHHCMPPGIMSDMEKKCILLWTQHV